MKTKKPMLKETVGALYLAFNTPGEDGKFDILMKKQAKAKL